MNRRIWLPLLALIVLALAAAGPADAKPKPAKCKGDKVPVKVKGKKRCKPLGKALPAPRDVDATLAYLQDALKLDPSKLSGKKGGKGKRSRRSGPSKKVLKAQKKARKAFLAALPEALREIDRLTEGEAGSAGRRSRRAQAAAKGCSGSPQGPHVTPEGNVNGLSLQGVVDGDTTGGSLQYSANGYTFRVSFRMCGNFGYFFVPDCPEANGDVSSSGSATFETTTETLKDGEVVHTQTTKQTWETKVRGKVAADARLDYIDIDDVEHGQIKASGGVSLKGTAVRRARVNMRTGGYDPAGASVAIKGDPGAVREGSFATRVGNAIRDFRAAEVGGDFLHPDGWTSFDRRRGGEHCVKPVISPDSETLRLRQGRRGQVAIQAKTRDGGIPTAARWTIVDALNARFTPTSLNQPSPTVDYTVTAAPPGGKVKMTAKVTSTAGVGKATWTQPIDAVPTINKIAGTFNSTYEVQIGSLDSVLDFSGNVTYERVTPALFGGAMGSYDVASGGYTVTASGTDGTMASACQQTGSKQLNLPPGASGGYFDVLGTPPEYLAPYAYSMVALAPGPQSMNVTLHDCPPGAEELEGDTVTIGIGSPALDTRAPFGDEQSDDGVHYDGSASLSQSGVSFDQSWSFTGTEQ